MNYNEASNSFRSAYLHIYNTKTTSLDGIKLSKIPKGDAPKLTQFYDWFKKLVLEMYKYMSIDGFTPGGYLLRPFDPLWNI